MLASSERPSAWLSSCEKFLEGVYQLGASSYRIRELIQDQGATPNIPPKSNRRWKPCFSKRLYRERNLIERFFSKLKHFRRVATRYDKLATNFLAVVQLASIRLWLRAYESTA